MKITQRIDNVTLVSEDYAHDTLPPPKSVKIELTARCDFSCFFCATRLRLRDKQDMDWDLLKTLLRQIRDAGVPEIGLFYLGESFLYPKLVTHEGDGPRIKDEPPLIFHPTLEQAPGLASGYRTRFTRFRYAFTLSPGMRLFRTPSTSPIFTSVPVTGFASTFVSRSKACDLSVLR